jgi:vacuolar protein sorting-associated protein 13A/C
MNLGNQPVEILIEDVYLLVVPSSQGSIDPEEEEQRAQATKMERLSNAELLHMHGQAGSIGEKIINPDQCESLRQFLQITPLSPKDCGTH